MLRSIDDVPAEGLGSIPLFAGIDRADLERVEHFMTRFECRPGEVLFAQGDESDRMHVIESGRVEVRGALPGGRSRLLKELGAGEVLGELSLLGAGRRTAGAAAVTRTTGWMLHRSGLQTLRLDAGAGSVELMARLAELAVTRLLARYEAIAAELGDGSTAALHRVAGGSPLALSHELIGADYLAGLLCFRGFHSSEQVRAAVGCSTAVEFAPGDVVLAPGCARAELLMVVRGALDVSIRRATGVQRVRLAGPGRLVGHACVAAGAAGPLVAHARERVIALRFPGEHVRAMLRGPTNVARLFSAAFAEDVARALAQAERPFARMSAERMRTAGA